MKKNHKSKPVQMLLPIFWSEKTPDGTISEREERLSNAPSLNDISSWKNLENPQQTNKNQRRLGR